ncbi:MAG TPA: cytochrome c peroxidase [Burkholderiales bacterium]
MGESRSIIRAILRASFPLAALLCLACGAASAQVPGQPLAQAVPLTLKAQVGKRMFFDTALSGSGKMSCATCHDPNNAYAPANNLAVQLGGPRLNLAGTRAVPSLRYKEVTPAYADLADNPDGVSPPGPGGGLMQDGRAESLAAQASMPLLAANEMAAKSPAEVAAKLKKSDYRDLFLQAFGPDAFSDPQKTFSAGMAALEAFQLEDDSFHPYTSKYDLYANNKIGGDLTAAQARGMRVFLDPEKGNCFACHYSGAGIKGSTAMFSDYSFSAIGVPRNHEIPANRKAAYYDLGICARDDHQGRKNEQYCGMFKTPTLRNVTTRKVFFHNGRFKNLAEVLRFYNTRDTDPELWYPKVNGRVQKFDDLPAAYRENIDKQGPLDGRKPGSKPPMTDEDLKDLEAFLGTLNDGYTTSPEYKAAVQHHAELQAQAKANK